MHSPDSQAARWADQFATNHCCSVHATVCLRWCRHSIARIDFTDASLHLPLDKIAIGPQGKLLEQQRPLLFRFKQYYLELATYLQEKLPMNIRILRCLKFLDFSVEISEDAVAFVAKKLSHVIPVSDMSSLQTEVWLLNMRTQSGEQLLADGDITRGWKKVSDAGKYPLLSRLATACCTLFHGNADAERLIGKSHDLSAIEKRNWRFIFLAVIFFSILYTSFSIFFMETGLFSQALIIPFNNLFLS